MKNKTSIDQTATPEFAASYIDERFYKTRQMRKINHKEIAFAKKLFSLVGSDGSILDIPCGSGRLTETFQSASKLFAFDYCDNMLNETKKQFAHHENISFKQADIRKIPLADNAVDASMCLRLLHHVETDEERSLMISELSRVSRKWVAFTFYRKESFRYFRRWLKGKKSSGHPVSIFRMKKIAEARGLRLISFCFLPRNQTLALFEVQE